jgi:hypothetical protein
MGLSIEIPPPPRIQPLLCLPASLPGHPSEGTPDSPVPREWFPLLQPGPGLDRLGWTQAIGGLALALIALFSSYHHISFSGRSLRLQQQWGIVFIAALLATVVVDAQQA